MSWLRYVSPNPTQSIRYIQQEQISDSIYKLFMGKLPIDLICCLHINKLIIRAYKS